LRAARRNDQERSRKNLGIIEAAKYGNTANHATLQQHAEKVSQMMGGSELTLYDKYLQLELLKHQQTMTGWFYTGCPVLE